MAVTYKPPRSPLASLRQLARLERYHLVFTENRLRSLIAAGSPRLNARGQIVPGNGILESGAIIRVGRRIYFDVDSFEAWLERRHPSARGETGTSAR